MPWNALLELEEDEAEENQGGDHKAAEELNQKWLEHVGACQNAVRASGSAEPDDG